MIYCVEDEKNIRELEVYTLILSGYDACGCADTVEFYEKADPKDAELFLLDIMLPGEDGLSILRKVKKNSIGEEAFCYCESLTDVTIPASVTGIGYSAFDACPNLTLTVTAGSYAETYAKENGLKYQYK